MTTSTVKYLGNLRTECTHILSGKNIITDAPLDNHGQGQAFSPTDLCATSLATCMITVMNIAAEGRKLQIDAMDAEVTKVMAANPRRISEIIIKLTIRASNLTDENKAILEEIGRNCPVAKSLHPDIKQDVTFYFQ